MEYNLIIAQTVSYVLQAGALMLALGGIFAVILLIASQKLKVQTDPKIERIEQALPGLDCGACGFAGCSQYAKAVADDPSLIGKCAPGGSQCANRIAEILNLEVSGGGAPKRPIVHCRAHTGDRTYYGEYYGIESCTAANAVAGVQACRWGCLGYGDCVASCQFEAIHIIDGLATVDYEKCTGCGACARACPRYIIDMVPFNHENMLTVACSSKETGKVNRKICDVGCIACGICAKQSDQFAIEENLAKADYENYETSEANENAYNKCPTGVIVYRGKTAPEPREPKKKKKAAKA